MALTPLPSHQFTPHIHHRLGHPLNLQLCLPHDPKHQLGIEPFPSPRAHSLIIEVGSDLAAIHTTLFQPKNAVYQGLMCRFNMEQRQSLDFNPNLNTKACRRPDSDPKKGQKEITPPSPTWPSSLACPHQCLLHKLCDRPAFAAAPRAAAGLVRRSARACV